jgi:hypothetical protein
VDRDAFFTAFRDADAVRYFYEPFLQAFDPELRRQLGVWYKPRPRMQNSPAPWRCFVWPETGSTDAPRLAWMVRPRFVLSTRCRRGRADSPFGIRSRGEAASRNSARCIAQYFFILIPTMHRPPRMNFVKEPTALQWLMVYANAAIAFSTPKSNN